MTTKDGPDDVRASVGGRVGGEAPAIELCYQEAGMKIRIPGPRLASIRIERFKSYREADLRLAPLTLLIGANASGKSNAIEALRLLSWLGQGQQLDDILRSVQEADIQIRGTIDDLVHGHGHTFSLGCRLAAAGEWDQLLSEWNRFSVQIRIQKSSMRIIQERMDGTGASSTAPLYEIKDAAPAYSHEVQVAYNNFARGGRKPRIPCTDKQAIFTQLATPARFEGKASQVIPAVLGKLRTVLQNILFLDPSPRRMRDYSFIIDNRLRGDGANLSSVLYHLCESLRGKEQILDFIRALPEQDIQDIGFIETPRNEVMVQLTETFAGKAEKRDAPVLSDGTLRALAVVAALLSAPEGSLVVIEEIDNGVHPSRAGMLLENILRITQKRGLRVLLTTHNPALLDALPAQAVPDVVFCYRDPHEGDSRLIRLEDVDRYPELVARGPLGQLMTQGIIERYVKNQRSDEARRKDARTWLHSLEPAADEP
jgi:predicted ATPase